jgi:multiple sugar transport system permease protein
MTTSALPRSAVAPPTVAVSTSSRRPVRHGENRAGWAFSAPFLVLYLVFLVGPMVYGVVMSFFNTTSVQGGLGEFVGVSNYSEAFTDSQFWASMWHTVLFTLITTPVLVVLALFFAVLAERARHARWFFRLAFFAPYVVPSASVVLIFAWMYAPEIGLADRVFGWFGASPNFLGEPAWAFTGVILLTVWWTVGFNFVLYLAGLQEIDPQLYEAAAVDGATGWAQFRSITLPLLGRTTALVVVLQLLSSLRVFDQIYLLLSGGPNFSTRPVLEYIYDVGFTGFRAGYAAAATTIYFVLLVLVSLVWFVLNRHRTAVENREATEEVAA